jgi:alpha/beta hydrolase family protein
MRALILALDRWVKGGAPPPASVYPRIADGTLVPASVQKWPALPGFAAPRSPNPMAQFDYGLRISEGIIETVPPAPRPFRYKVLVPQVDADGNELAGLRVPEQAVPFATTTGWALRSAEGGAAGELCYLDGMALPFARTAAEREAAKDPRLSLAERYQDRAAFISKIRNSAKELQSKGYLLDEDIEKIVGRAGRAW